jgi:hypothetical protein
VKREGKRGGVGGLRTGDGGGWETEGGRRVGEGLLGRVRVTGVYGYLLALRAS